MHAKIKNNVVVEYPIVNLRQYLSDTSLPADLTVDSGLPAGFVYVRPAPIPEYDYNTQILVLDPQPRNVDGLWYSFYNAVNMNPQQLAEHIARQSQVVRSQRNQKLTESDWTQIADATVDKAAWAVYRQALRDISNQAGFPTAVTWPAPPTA